jgi:large subunit ribosomal protein L13
MEKYTIDAKGKKLGRIATDAAVHLMGKHRTDFAKNVVADVEVEIINASNLNISAKKLQQSKHLRYSGYPGGLKERSLQEVIDKKGYEEVVRKAVYGMLPGNRLRPELMKRLTVTT